MSSNANNLYNNQYILTKIKSSERKLANFTIFTKINVSECIHIYHVRNNMPYSAKIFEIVNLTHSLLFSPSSTVCTNCTVGPIPFVLDSKHINMFALLLYSFIID